MSLSIWFTIQASGLGCGLVSDSKENHECPSEKTVREHPEPPY